MLKVAIAHSLDLDSKEAIEDVLSQCSEQLGDLKPQAALLFTHNDSDFQLILDRINETYPGIELIGGTTAGEISSVHGVVDDSIVLTLFYSDELNFKAGIAEKISEDPLMKLKNAAEAIKSDLNKNPNICIVIPSNSTLIDGTFTIINTEDVLRGLKSSLGETFSIFGGCAANLKYTGDHQFYNNNAYVDSAALLLISGPLKFSYGIESGWTPIGKRTKITHAEKNIVFKIGDQSALNFYKHYLGESDFMGVTEYGLAIFDKDEESFYLRGALTFDEEQGYISFGSSIPEGAIVQLTHTTRDNIIDAVKKSVNSAVIEYPGSNPSIALCFSCAARKWVLGTRVEEEYQVLQRDFPDLPVVGFYSGGEIGPIGIGKPIGVHNYTFVCLLMGVD